MRARSNFTWEVAGLAIGAALVACGGAGILAFLPFGVGCFFSFGLVC